MAKGKANDIESDERTALMVDMLIDRYPRQTILRFCAENWGISTRQSEEDIAKAKAKIRESGVYDRVDEIADAKLFYERMQQRALNPRKYKTKKTFKVKKLNEEGRSYEEIETVEVDVQGTPD